MDVCVGWKQTEKTESCCLDIVLGIPFWRKLYFEVIYFLFIQMLRN